MILLKPIILYIGCVVLGSSASSLVPFIEKCRANDSPCIIKSATNALPYFIKGLPEFGIPPLEPIVLKDVNADKGELKLFFKDLHLEGSSKTKFVTIQRDAENSTAKIVIDLPVNITGEYVIGGKFLILDVVGEGSFKFHTDKLRIFFDVRLKTFNSKYGKLHYKITGYDYNYEFLKKAYVKFGNLFNGDKSKAEPVEQLLDKYWKELIPELGKPVLKESVIQIAGHIGKLFINVPAEQLEIA